MPILMRGGESKEDPDPFLRDFASGCRQAQECVACLWIAPPLDTAIRQVVRRLLGAILGHSPRSGVHSGDKAQNING